MNNFQPFWCMLLGDQAGKRISSRACIALHRALKYTAAIGYDVEDIEPVGEVGKWRIDRGLRCTLRQEEDEETTTAEYVTIILRFQKNRIVERDEVEDILTWLRVQFDQDRVRELYRWRLVRDLMSFPNPNRGPNDEH